MTTESSPRDAQNAGAQTDAPREQIRETARETFGYERLRAGQEDAIASVVSGRDTLVVAPTGSGKSAIYQIAGQLLGGLVVVVSPLIALQRDQAQALEREDAGETAILNSTLTVAQRRATVGELEHGRLDYLFLAPEQFGAAETIERLRAARPALFVVDEAHCVSEWGHSFRPDYLRLGAVIEALGHPPVLALTATAAPPVREEIMERLGMRDGRVIVRGFDRPNIWLGVERFEDEGAKLRALRERVREADTPGIVYAATRRHADDVAEALRNDGVRAAAYHAGLRAEERNQIEDAFLGDEIEVIVATTAFGMGIDKPNVRFVFHYEISESLDAYYQEFGRAGRDGAPARARLFYHTSDIGVRRFFAGAGRLDAEQVERVAEAVAEHEQPVDVDELQKATDLSESKVTTALSRLEEAGVVELLPTGEAEPAEQSAPLEVVAEAAAQTQERYRAFERSRVLMMQNYAETQDCRRAFLLNYFGQEYTPPCGACDNCQSGRSLAALPTDEPFPLNTRVVHNAFGVGLVQRYEGDKMVVLFDETGYKTLDTRLVTSEGLLHPAE